jgi:hypothetical protein
MVLISADGERQDSSGHRWYLRPSRMSWKLQPDHWGFMIGLALPPFLPRIHSMRFENEMAYPGCMQM